MTGKIFSGKKIFFPTDRPWKILESYRKRQYYFVPPNFPGLSIKYIEIPWLFRREYFSLTFPDFPWWWEPCGTRNTFLGTKSIYKYKYNTCMLVYYSCHCTLYVLTYSIFSHVTPFIGFHFREVQLGWIRSDRCLSDRVALCITDGNTFIFTAQSQQILSTPRTTCNLLSVFAKDWNFSKI